MAWETAKKIYFNNWRVQRPQNIINKPGLLDRFLKKKKLHFFKKWHFPETQLYLVYNSVLKQNAQNASFSVFDLDTRGDLSFITNKAIYIVKSPPIFFFPW